MPLQIIAVRLLLIATAFSALPAMAADAHAQQIGEELASRLTEAQTRAYIFYLRAHAQYRRDADAYWSAVDDLREQRRRKRSSGRPFSPSDYVAVQPPRYQGPSLPADVAKIIASLRPARPEEKPEPMPGVADFLTHARTLYRFVPAPTSEAVFKRRYAEEALSLGLSKDQVVRVYALETGGRGTYDMQAGIDPESKRGTPISSALGYAQLLGANSVSELVRHGEGFAQRLEVLAASPGNGRVRAQLLAKATAVRRMVRAARSVPNVWSAHVAMSRTPKGLGIHALNLDADIGPWLQAVKLRGIRDHAEKAGRMHLSGAEIELMNLAGPQTGLDMMEPAGRDAPTANFFSRKAYDRNPIVKDKTSAELLAALESRMDQNIRKPGSGEFARGFDAALAAHARAAAFRR